MSDIHIPQAADLAVTTSGDIDHTWAVIGERTGSDAFVRISVSFNRADYRQEDANADKQANIILAHRILNALALLEKHEQEKANA